MSEENNKAPVAAEKATEETPAPVDPRIEKANEALSFIQGKITSEFGEAAIEEAGLKQFVPTFVIKNELYAEVAEFLKTEQSLLFNYPQCMAGTDYKDYIEVYFLIHSTEKGYDVAIKARGDRENGSVPTLSAVYAYCNWEEREIYDLLGLNFRNHPDMRRIMLQDEWNGHPLRKDYVVRD